MLPAGPTGHHPSARLELPYQRPRNLIRPGRHHDRVEGSALLPSLVAVTYAALHVAVAKALEPRSRLDRDRLHDLDGADRAHETPPAPPPGNPSRCRSRARGPASGVSAGGS